MKKFLLTLSSLSLLLSSSSFAVRLNEGDEQSHHVQGQGNPKAFDIDDLPFDTIPDAVIQAFESLKVAPPTFGSCVRGNNGGEGEIWSRVYIHADDQSNHDRRNLLGAYFFYTSLKDKYGNRTIVGETGVKGGYYDGSASLSGPYTVLDRGDDESAESGLYFFRQNKMVNPRVLAAPESSSNESQKRIQELEAQIAALKIQKETGEEAASTQKKQEPEEEEVMWHEVLRAPDNLGDNRLGNTYRFNADEAPLDACMPILGDNGKKGYLDLTNAPDNEFRGPFVFEGENRFYLRGNCTIYPGENDLTIAKKWYDGTWHKTHKYKNMVDVQNSAQNLDQAFTPNKQPGCPTQ